MKGTYVFHQDKLVHKLYTNNTTYDDEWNLILATLLCWNSDSDKVAFWGNNPTLFSENTVINSTFYYSDGYSCAKSQWESALNLSITTAPENSANIKCYGVLPNDPRISDYYEFQDCAITLASYIDTNETVNWGSSIKTITRMYSATIYIISKSYSVSEQKNVFTHELGHALGYRGHSLNSNHVMYPYQSTDYILKQDEINHLKQIYDMH